MTQRSPGPPVGTLAAPTGSVYVETLADFDVGFLVGILVGEGHFGGDGRQPQVTLRMHADHEALFRWLERRFPGSRLYGPYDHSGRRYYQWMARGRFLRDELLPLLRARLRPEHSGRVWDRFVAMCADYGLGRPDAADRDPGPGPGGDEPRDPGPTMLP